MVRVNSSIQSRIRARQNSQPNLMERAHNQWKNLHPVGEVSHLGWSWIYGSAGDRILWKSRINE